MRQLLARVVSHQERYAQLSICTPYLDDDMARTLVTLLCNEGKARCAVRIFTAPAAAKMLRALLPGHPVTWRKSILTVVGIHAKVYVCVARQRQESEAIITSANLTTAGTELNVELGVQMITCSEGGRQLFAEASDFVRRLAAA